MKETSYLSLLSAIVFIIEFDKNWNLKSFKIDLCVL